MLLTPFDAGRNIDLQGLILLVACGFACLSLGMSYRQTGRQLKNQPVLTFALVFIAASLISTLFNPHVGYDLIGPPYVRLGALSFISCLSCALVAERLPARTIMSGIYGLIVVTAVISIPYSLIMFHSLYRIGGLFAQADLLACYVGCGLLLGFGVLQQGSHRHIILASQTLLAAVLVLTQTRAVVAIVLVLCVLSFLLQRPRSDARYYLFIVCLIVILSLGLGRFSSSRLTDSKLAYQGVTYRLTLQSFALHATTQKPFLGYGPGNETGLPDKHLV